MDWKNCRTCPMAAVCIVEGRHDFIHMLGYCRYCDRVFMTTLFGETYVRVGCVPHVNDYTRDWHRRRICRSCADGNSPMYNDEVTV